MKQQKSKVILYLEIMKEMGVKFWIWFTCLFGVIITFSIYSWDKTRAESFTDPITWIFIIIIIIITLIGKKIWM